VHEVHALLPDPELQQLRRDAEFPDPGGDRLAEVVVGQYGQQPHAGSGCRSSRRDVQRVPRDAELRRHTVAEHDVGGHLDEDFAHHDDVERLGFLHCGLLPCGFVRCGFVR
jgi:hypothetical protein